MKKGISSCGMCLLSRGKGCSRDIHIMSTTSPLLLTDKPWLLPAWIKPRSYGDWARGFEQGSFTNFNLNAEYLRMSPDGTVLATTSRDRLQRLLLQEIPSGVEIRQLIGHGDVPNRRRVLA